MSVRAINRKKKELAKEIRSFSKSQKEFWQLVPDLALEADGRSGYSDNFSRAYHNGVWAVDSSKDNTGYNVYVDLATGELISAWAFHDKKELSRPAPDKYIIRINPEDLDAGKLVAWLRKWAREEVSRYLTNSAEEIAEWRQEIRRGTGLKEVFTQDQRGPISAPSYFD